MGTNARHIIATFHSAATESADGLELDIHRGMVLMTVAITGDAIGFTLVFEGKAHGEDDYTPIMVVNLATFILSATTTANGKYQMSLEGLTKVKVRLSSITSGSCTATGTVVD